MRALAFVVLLLISIGCQNGAVDAVEGADLDKHLDQEIDAVYERQVAEMDRQMAEYQRQLEIGDEQARRFDKLLSRWEEQADRYDAILENWEKQSAENPSLPR